MAKKTATFAQRLREGLDLRGMKQIELATRSGISKYSISHYLKGDWEGKQDAVYELARALNVSADGVRRPCGKKRAQSIGAAR